MISEKSQIARLSSASSWVDFFVNRIDEKHEVIQFLGFDLDLAVVRVSEPESGNNTCGRGVQSSSLNFQHKQVIENAWD